jgi:filamentous hemagglutinin family protein
MKSFILMKSFIFCLGLVSFTLPALAQVTPDGTLSTSVTSTDSLNFAIENGDRVGNNLFHSFRDFSIPTGGSASFNNAIGVQNIFSRVTGGNLSNIDGLLRANGSANLFLINPSGIVFGRNARLAIGGSFIGSTANSIRFLDGTEFSAVNPTGASLLTISIPIGLQFGTNSGDIRVNGLGNSEVVPSTQLGLATVPGSTLAFVGGNVTFNGGIATAASGRLEVGSVRNGTVNLMPTSTGWRLGYDAVQEFGTIQLLNRASLWNPYPIANPQGGIQVQGGRIILDNSQIAAASLGAQASQDINIRASESLKLGGTGAVYPFSSWIANLVIEGSSGQGGRVLVETPRLEVLDGSRIQASTVDRGSSGDIQINADSVLVRGYSPINADRTQREAFVSQILSSSTGTGRNGHVSVSSEQVRIQNGGQIVNSAGERSIEPGGNVIVNASRFLRITGGNPLNPRISGIVTNTSGVGDGGNIQVSTNELVLRNGGAIGNSSLASGDAGDITIRANTIAASGVNSAFGYIRSGVQSYTFDAGRGGDVRLFADNLSLRNGGTIGTFTIAPVDGTPLIDSSGTGNAGNVFISADEAIEVSGEAPAIGGGASSLSSITFSSGNAGNVNIRTRRLSVRNGGNVTSGVVFSLGVLGGPVPRSGTGNGGNLTVNASESVEVRGVSPGIFDDSDLEAYSLGRGNAGQARINTPQLRVLNGGSVGAGTSGTGDGNRVIVNADDILVSGRSPNGTRARLTSSAELSDPVIRQAFFLPPRPTGDTGEVIINADRLTIAEGGEVGVEHQGTGMAGRLSINANSVTLHDRGLIAASTISGGGGNLRINAQRFLMLDNQSQISAEAGGQGNGGNISLATPFVFAFNNSDIIANADRGNGGNIDITTQGIFGTEYRPQLTPRSDITASSESGSNGIVQIETPDVAPESGLIALPENLTDSSSQIAATCDSTSQFIITGRGGLPHNPAQIGSDRAWADVRDPAVYRSQQSTPAIAPDAALPEATEWVTNAAGQTELVAAGSVQVPEQATCSRESSD